MGIEDRPPRRRLRCDASMAMAIGGVPVAVRGGVMAFVYRKYVDVRIICSMRRYVDALRKSGIPSALCIPEFGRIREKLAHLTDMCICIHRSRRSTPAR